MMKNSGYSSVELVAILLTTGILAAMGAMVFSTVSNAYGLDTAAYALYVDLQEARLHAIKRNKTVGFSFDSSTKTYSSTEGTTRSLPNRVAVTSVEGTLSFSSRGTASPMTITLANDYGTRQISINTAGRIQISRP